MDPENWYEKFSPIIRLYVRTVHMANDIEVEFQDTGCALDLFLRSFFI
jgi:hypothetical protein